MTKLTHDWFLSFIRITANNKLAVVILWVLVCSNLVKASGIGTVDSLKTESNSKEIKVSGKLYVSKGTFISGIEEDESLEVVLVEPVQKKTQKKKETVINQKKEEVVTESDSPAKKKKVEYLNSVEVPITFFYSSANGIKTVIPVPSPSSKLVLYKASTPIDHQFQNSTQQKIRILSAEISNSDFQLGACTVRPPPQVLL
ncbi:MAG TPA: hypothetical protein VKY36_04420 [Moheibacter sp.]|nr:hypothetical protein [Moheibacter sp.]